MRVSPEERESIVAMAEAEGRSISDFAHRVFFKKFRQYQDDEDPRRTYLRNAMTPLFDELGYEPERREATINMVLANFHLFF
ncbi:hypothetical protein [Primorskyibacter flagellatus]